MFFDFVSLNCAREVKGKGRFSKKSCRVVDTSRGPAVGIDGAANFPKEVGPRFGPFAFATRILQFYFGFSIVCGIEGFLLPCR